MRWCEWAVKRAIRERRVFETVLWGWTRVGRVLYVCIIHCINWSLRKGQEVRRLIARRLGNQNWYATGREWTQAKKEEDDNMWRIAGELRGREDALPLVRLKWQLLVPQLVIGGGRRREARIGQFEFGGVPCGRHPNRCLSDRTLTILVGWDFFCKI